MEAAWVEPWGLLLPLQHFSDAKEPQMENCLHTFGLMHRIVWALMAWHRPFHGNSSSEHETNVCVYSSIKTER